MIVLPLALFFGAVVGFLVRGHDRVVMVIAIATPVAALLALAAQFVPGGAMECTASSSGPSTCRAVAAVTGWGEGAVAIALGLQVVSFLPIVSARLHVMWPAVVAAVLQAVPQVISVGGFVAWAPALLLTVCVAFAVGGTVRQTSGSRT